MEYTIPIQEEKVKPHQVTTLHMVCALAFLGTGAIIAVYNYTIPGWGIALLCEGLLLVGLTMFRNKWVLQPQVNRIFRVVQLLTAIAVAGYSFLQHWKVPEGVFGVLSLCLAFALYWEKSVGETLNVIIDEGGIHLPVTARKRLIEWKEVENVVLRHGTLSVNCVDDRLFQWTARANKIEVADLEQFCAALVSKHETEKEEDW